MNTVGCVLILSLCVASIASSLHLQRVDNEGNQSCNRSLWSSFKEQFAKKYQDVAEDSRRFSLFCKNYQEILEHNSQEAAGYEMGVNQFTDMSSEEADSYTNGLFNETNEHSIIDLSRLDERQHNYLAKFGLNMTREVPDFVDWSSDPKAVSPPRNQGFCGSCWAFAIVGMLEGQDRANGTNRLSEQNLIDCNPTGAGCSGGYLMEALRDIKKMGGLVSQADYPYVSAWKTRRQRCRMDEIGRSKIVPFTSRLGEPKVLKFGDEQQLKQVVATYGPVAIGYHSTENFRRYKSGIYYDASCPSFGNHAMLVVGYGTDSSGQDYWKLKNSWGDSWWNPFAKWGMRGFGLVARNRKNNCAIASHGIIIKTDLIDWP